MIAGGDASLLSCADLPPELLPAGLVETFEDGTFQIADGEHGTHALLLQVWSSDGELEDVVAWQLEGPGHPWWRQRGNVALLGEDEIRDSGETGRPVRLVSTPRRWLELRGKVAAACILDWGEDPRALLSRAAEVVCETPALRSGLEAAIAKHSRPPFKIRCAA